MICKSTVYALSKNRQNDGLYTRLPNLIYQITQGYIQEYPRYTLKNLAKHF